MRASGYSGRVIGLVAGLAGLAAPAHSIAATTIGETGNLSSDCDAGFTLLQGSVAAGGPSYEVPPSGGVITSWSYLAGASADQIRFEAFRPAGGDQVTVIFDSGIQTMTPNTLNTFPAQAPVEAGDVIGLHTVTNGSTCANTQNLSTLDQIRGCTMCDPPLGTTFAAPVLEAGNRLNVSATLEPDCDSDGLGDEGQDPSISSCHPRTLALDANKNKVKRGRRVALSGQIAETGQDGSCTANQAVELQRKRPAQVGFTIVARLTTDAAGSFSAKEKVKKTFEYRAEVDETATCDDDLSNIEKVKVKKPK
jgi:hypothetical protein